MHAGYLPRPLESLSVAARTGGKLDHSAKSGTILTPILLGNALHLGGWVDATICRRLPGEGPPITVQKFTATFLIGVSGAYAAIAGCAAPGFRAAPPAAVPAIAEPTAPGEPFTRFDVENADGESIATSDSRSPAIPLLAVRFAPPDSSPPPVLPATHLLSMDEIPPPAAAETPIDLSSALQIAAGENPQVAFAQQRIREAFAQLQSAQVLWVPSLRAGMNYNNHQGRIQNVEGDIIETSRGSLYSGLGAQAVGASSPAVPGLLMSFHFRDAIFQPRIAAGTLAANRQAERAVTNDILTDTAVAYTNLLEAAQYRAVATDTLAHAQTLADLTADFARTGQGLLADADRAQTELALQQIEVRRAEENVQVGSAQLAQLLSQDPTVALLPQEPAIAPIEMVQEAAAPAELVATGLSNRPELAESRWLVATAVERLRRERYAPLVPSVLLGVSYGVNGGGLGSDLTNFGDRVDADAVAYWEVRNLGWGERAARDAARAQVDQTRWQQVRLMDQVASEIAQAYAQVTARRQQIILAQDAIRAATESYERNSERIRNAQGLPIETLQSIQALNQARRQYVRVVADYNRAQFSLQRSLGWPISVPASP
jgi:outer membrane protein TolC